MTLQRIIHVAQIELLPTTGMGRIACEWRDAAQRRGIEFIHIGSSEVGPVPHRLLFPVKARRLAEKIPFAGTAVLIHEPCGWAFKGMPLPKVGFSHGIEPRGAKIERTFQQLSLKSRMMRPVLNWLGYRSLRSVDTMLVSNAEDRQFLLDHALLSAGQIHIFRNGIDVDSSPPTPASSEVDQTILFNASWLKRKGTAVLIQAAIELASRGIRPRWCLVGTGFSREEVLADWPEDLRGDVTVIPRFQRGEEGALLAGARIFVLPSYFEGQSLALSQAMAASLCCITSDCCGQRDLIRDGDNGLLFPPGNALILADLIQKVWTDHFLRDQLGTRAAASLAAFDWPTVAGQVIAWVSEVQLA